MKCVLAEETKPMSQTPQPEAVTFSSSRIGRMMAIAALVLMVFSGLSVMFAADSAPQVTLSVAKVGPREVEPLTQRSVVRDYKFAWANLDLALQSNSTGPLNGLFVGPASAWLSDEVKGQKQNGI